MCLVQGHKSQVLCLAFSPDSQKMVTASKDGTWRVWNINVRFHQQEDPKCLIQHTQEVRTCTLHALPEHSVVLHASVVYLLLSYHSFICIHNHSVTVVLDDMKLVHRRSQSLQSRSCKLLNSPFVLLT